MELSPINSTVYAWDRAVKVGKKVALYIGVEDY